jgi:hypothetical protein
MKLFHKVNFNILCAVSVMTMAGCVPLIIGAAAGVGGVAYVNGSLVRNVDEPVEKVHKAALAGLKKLGLFVTSDELDKHSSTIRAQYEDAKKVRVSIEALTEYVTQVSIRVGTFGNQDESYAILDAILEKI